MATTREAVKVALEKLQSDGRAIVEEMAGDPKKNEKTKKPNRKKYQAWYSLALPVVRQLVPDRYDEFQSCYSADKRKDLTLRNFTISDYFVGVSLVAWGDDTPLDQFVRRFVDQLAIVDAAAARLDSILADVRGALQAEMFDDELHAASVLAKSGFLRAAGALAGVALERHLSAVAERHQVKLKTKEPTIAQLNDPLREAGITDLPTWRFIQRLGDLRNLCDHAKTQEPTKEQVAELLDGVSRITKTVN